LWVGTGAKAKKYKIGVPPHLKLKFTWEGMWEINQWASKARRRKY
jgi:hypothetical protein